LRAAPPDSRRWKPDIPKVWDETALADWATPLAGLNLRPTHISANEYYSLKVDNLRTYPVYFPGREPDGYWEMLQHIGPRPLIEPKQLQTEADWIEAGRRAFDEADHLHLRTFDPGFVAAARSPATFEQADVDGRRPVRRPTRSWLTNSGLHLKVDEREQLIAFLRTL
jgi:hypothetical protein